ncbi:MAG TPA: hypothetical protein VKE73_01880, partial [Myxococcota bacterium]|nr:hypothetical protein [Myxococcota bacterium]
MKILHQVGCLRAPPGPTAWVSIGTTLSVLQKGSPGARSLDALPLMPHGGPVIDVVLLPGRDKAARRRHPWVLSGAVARVQDAAESPQGAWSRVLSAEGETLGFGHYCPASQIRVRLLVFGKDPPDDGLLAERIGQAVARRAADPLIGDTDAVRLVNGEADGLPGLVVDRYRDVVVVKLGSAGMSVRRALLAGAL